MKEILTKAHKDSTADYQGYGKFWELPLSELLEIKIYGVRMIAEAPPAIDCGTFEQGASSTLISLPTTSADCCCSTPKPSITNIPASQTTAKNPGRGEKSGLIIALRGQTPFDNTQFPPFMWGGDRVDASDIQFISNWIDDGCPQSEDLEKSFSDWIKQGCPDTNDPEIIKKALEAFRAKTADAQKSAAPLQGAQLDLRLGKIRHELSTRPTNTIKSESGQLRQRKNVECLNDDEVCRLRAAIAYMQKLSREFELDDRGYETYAKLHGNSCQHGWEQFLPWHRYMLYSFEKQMQEFVPDVMLAYWDWPMKMFNKGIPPKPSDVKLPKGVKAVMPKEFVSGIIPTYYRCYLNEKAVNRLISLGVPDKIKPITDMMYNSGIEFLWVVAQLIGQSATDNYKKAIVAELKTVNPLWHELRYPGMFYDQNAKTAVRQDMGLQEQFHHHYPIQDDLDEMLLVNNWRDFGGGPLVDESFGVLDNEPHNTVHLWVGGENPFNFNGTFPNPLPENSNPPIGSMLGNLTAAYDPIFYAHHSNVDRMWALWQQKWPGQTAFDPNAQLPGLDAVVSQTWSTQSLGYEYVQDSKYCEADSSAGFKMLLTEKLGIHERAMAYHQKVVLILHKVIPPKRSFALRVFLNLPNAHEGTAVKDNDHFAGQISFFGHGDCIGGPGHCDMPGEREKFDMRPLRHNRPGNHRIDITQAVQRLKAKGANDIEVKLVSVNTGLLDVHEILRFEGLSINFH